MRSWLSPTPPSRLRRQWRSIRTLVAIATVLAIVCLGIGAAADTASASNAAAGLGDDRELTVPAWLTVFTGGVAIGASALLAALVTDRQLVDTLHTWSLPLSPSVRDSPDHTTPSSALAPHLRELASGLWWLTGLVGVAALVGTVVVGLTGPGRVAPTANLAVILSFVGLRSLLPMVAFLVGNPWPALDPFRRLARALTALGEGVMHLLPPIPSSGSTGTDGTDTRAIADGGPGLLAYPSALASWPAVVGLGTLVWLELVLPVTSDPALLARLAAGYTIYTVAGAILFGSNAWFRRADPLATVFRLYGAVAPIQRRRDGRGLTLVLPGSRLRDPDLVTDASEVAFVLLLVWELTFNGFVVTPPGSRLLAELVGAGVPVAVATLAVFVGGYAVALGLYWLAASTARRTAPTYLSTATLARRFAPPLLAIAAGYHVAHYVGVVLSLSPAAVAVVTSPLSPPLNPTTLALPGWVGTLEIGALLAGHLLAVWVAHATAFDCFPGRLQAIRSQYPLIAVMVCYTAVSLWLLTLPTVQPPTLAG
ncbi:hypothetical protein [Natrialba asiatica]|uniref:Uncharacterized protein n=1 Tax=Natrialba asiatica (strain ATCC 700177 / DSM 12278 / JCM 9576 / FERM P-10747 / NBRC 102637 / 172P1) TaxID=29540 RepID=M0AT77_NATA1|nr:hypothetical protein [Natrialba asiatica]ELZ00574.1 hypothetical protein C481_13059 [Natrialba asiatica DSM 12278]